MLGCAPQGLPPLATLDEKEQEQLCSAIEQSLHRHDQAMQAAVPEFLRPVITALRRRP